MYAVVSGLLEWSQFCCEWMTSIVLLEEEFTVRYKFHALVLERATIPRPFNEPWTKIGNNYFAECVFSDLNPILNFLQNYKSNPFNTKNPSEPVWTKSKATYFLKQLNYNKTKTSKYSLTWIDISFGSTFWTVFSISRQDYG